MVFRFSCLFVAIPQLGLEFVTTRANSRHSRAALFCGKPASESGNLFGISDFEFRIRLRPAAALALRYT